MMALARHTHRPQRTPYDSYRAFTHAHARGSETDEVWSAHEAMADYVNLPESDKDDDT